VWGVLFSLDEQDESAVDLAEGLGSGYVKCSLRVHTPEKRVVNAIVYVATADARDAELRPYSWYLRLVSLGATQHNLPENYLDKLRQVETWEDADRKRDAARRSINC